MINRQLFESVYKASHLKEYGYNAAQKRDMYGEVTDDDIDHLHQRRTHKLDREEGGSRAMASFSEDFGELITEYKAIFKDKKEAGFRQAFVDVYSQIYTPEHAKETVDAILS